MAAKGYPGNYGKGSVIEGLDDAAQVEGVEIFHAGTKAEAASASSPMAGACSMSARSGKTVREAQTRAYAAVDRSLAGRLLPPRYRLARDRAGE